MIVSLSMTAILHPRGLPGINLFGVRQSALRQIGRSRSRDLPLAYWGGRPVLVRLFYTKL